MTIPRLAILVAMLAGLLTAGAPGPAEAQNFRFGVNFQTDLTNYLQMSEFLDPIHTMVGIPNGPFPSVCGTPLCDPAFAGWYKDLYVVGVIDGIEFALSVLAPGNVLRCGNLIPAISDTATTKIQAVDPALRGSQGATIAVTQAAGELGCTIGP